MDDAFAEKIILQQCATWFSRNQDRKRLHRDYMLRQMRREFKHGHKNPIRTAQSAKGTTRSARQSSMGGSGDAPESRQDSDGD
tara:strand:- start:13 stop:261 length:249 start_codon:yes stop_codon:yes gene_type:complete